MKDHPYQHHDGGNSMWFRNYEKLGSLPLSAELL